MLVLLSEIHATEERDRKESKHFVIEEKIKQFVQNIISQMWRSEGQLLHRGKKNIIGEIRNFKSLNLFQSAVIEASFVHLYHVDGNRITDWWSKPPKICQSEGLKKTGFGYICIYFTRDNTGWLYICPYNRKKKCHRFMSHCTFKLFPFSCANKWFVTRKWMVWIIKHLSLSNLRNQFPSLYINGSRRCCGEPEFASRRKAKQATWTSITFSP